MYKLVLLDIDDTIFDYKKAEDNALRKTFEDFGYFCGGMIEEKYILLKKEYGLINKRLWEELEKGEVSKEELRVKRFSELFEKFSLEYNAEKFSLRYIKRLSEANYLFEGAEELCRYLHSKYKVIIVTNGIKEVQYPRILNSNIAKYIDNILVSDDVGVSKPNPGIFEYALNLVNHSVKSDVIILGDSLTADIQGGLDFGIDTCWVNLKGLPEREDIKPKYTVRDYEELYGIL